MVEFTFEPVGRVNQTGGEQSDIKSEMTGPSVNSLLFRRQQIEEQRTNADFADGTGNELIAGTVPATAGTVGEQHHALRAGWNTQIAVKHRSARANLNVAGSSGSCGWRVNHLTLT